jgi:hypothetical protein
MQSSELEPVIFVTRTTLHVTIRLVEDSLKLYGSTRRHIQEGSIPQTYISENFRSKYLLWIYNLIFKILISHSYWKWQILLGRPVAWIGTKVLRFLDLFPSLHHEGIHLACRPKRFYPQTILHDNFNANMIAFHHLQWKVFFEENYMKFPVF